MLWLLMNLRQQHLVPPPHETPGELLREPDQRNVYHFAADGLKCPSSEA